jgi:hypothetical protein
MNRAIVGLLLSLLFCAGCDSGPDLPGPLPATAPYPGPPLKARAAWSELRLFNLKGEPISSIPVDTPFRAVLRVRLEEGSPMPEHVRIGVGLIDRRDGAWVSGGMRGTDAKPDETGEIRFEYQHGGLRRARKDWLVRGSFSRDNYFAEVPLEAVEAPKD